MNKYSTQDWRFFILKMQTTGLLKPMLRITPATKVLATFNGIQAVKRALAALDETEESVPVPLEALPGGYWVSFQSDLFARKTVSGLWPHGSYEEAGNAV